MLSDLRFRHDGAASHVSDFVDIVLLTVTPIDRCQVRSLSRKQSFKVRDLASHAGVGL